jgi:hypothetical protein
MNNNLLSEKTSALFDVGQIFFRAPQVARQKCIGAPDVMRFYRRKANASRWQKTFAFATLGSAIKNFSLR